MNFSRNKKISLPWGFFSASLLFLLFPLFLLFFFTATDAPEKRNFEDDRAEITAERDKAVEEYKLLSPEDDPAAPRQKILFYEGALKFSLPVWSGDFYFEGASLWAMIQREWEILNANKTEENTPRRRYLEEQDRLLSQILEKKDAAAFPDFYRSWLEGEGKMSQEEIEEEVFSLRLRILSSEDGYLSPAESEWIARIKTLEESLREGKNRFDPAREDTPLSQKDAARFAKLKDYYWERLSENNDKRVPSNDETLSFGESFFSFLLLPAVILCLAEEKKRQGLSFLSPKSAFLYLPLFSLFLTLGIYLSAYLFAPASLLAAPFFFGEDLHLIPCFTALFLRILLRALSLTPFFFLFFALIKKGLPQGKTCLFFSLGALLYEILSFAARLFFHSSPLHYFLPFIYTDLAGALLPFYPIHLFTPAPAVALSGFALLTGLAAFFYQKKKTT